MLKFDPLSSKTQIIISKLANFIKTKQSLLTDSEFFIQLSENIPQNGDGQCYNFLNLFHLIFDSLNDAKYAKNVLNKIVLEILSNDYSLTCQKTILKLNAIELFLKLLSKLKLDKKIVSDFVYSLFQSISSLLEEDEDDHDFALGECKTFALREIFESAELDGNIDDLPHEKL